MATYSFNFYEGAPFENGIPYAGTPGSSFIYTGPSSAVGSIDITDNGTGADGQTLTSNDTATADATINGLTSIGSNVSAARGYLVEDSVTGQEFTVIRLAIESGDAAGAYTLSEIPLVAGRSYVLKGWASSPSATSPAAFTYAEYACFASGTLIATVIGPQPVEKLCVGSSVITLDHGPQPIIWHGSRTLTFGPENEKQKPILFRPDALGPGCPTQELIVSPQHRILLKNGSGDAANDVNEFLGPAKAFATWAGVRVMRGKRSVTYHTLMTERHEVIFANGLGTETFYPGPQSLSFLSPEEISEITTAVSSINRIGPLAYGPPARRILDRRAICNLSSVSGTPMHDLQSA